MTPQAGAARAVAARDRAQSPRHPIQHAAALARPRRWHWLYTAARERSLLNGLLLVLAVVAVISLPPLTIAPLREALPLALQHPWLPLLVCTVACGVVSLRRRRRLRQAFVRSWLAALPLPTPPDRAQFVAVVRPSVLTVLAAALWLRVVAHGAAYDGFLLAWVGCGSVGCLIGWRLGASEARTRTPAPSRLPRDLMTTPVGLHALGRWPLRQALLNANPGLHARALGALLMSAPMGTPARYAVAAMLLAAIVIFWLELARGLLQSIPAAARALHSLPLSRASFVRTLSTRSAGLTVLSSAVGCVTLLALDVKPGIALLFGVLGMAAVSAATLVAFAIASGSSGRAD